LFEKKSRISGRGLKKKQICFFLLSRPEKGKFLAKYPPSDQPNLPKCSVVVVVLMTAVMLSLARSQSGFVGTDKNSLLWSAQIVATSATLQPVQPCNQCNNATSALQCRQRLVFFVLCFLCFFQCNICCGGG
jgi:hypothetical protein